MLNISKAILTRLSWVRVNLPPWKRKSETSHQRGRQVDQCRYLRVAEGIVADSIPAVALGRVYDFRDCFGLDARFGLIFRYKSQLTHINYLANGIYLVVVRASNSECVGVYDRASAGNEFILQVERVRLLLETNARYASLHRSFLRSRIATEPAEHRRRPLLRTCRYRQRSLQQWCDRFLSQS